MLHPFVAIRRLFLRLSMRVPEIEVLAPHRGDKFANTGDAIHVFQSAQVSVRTDHPMVQRQPFIHYHRGDALGQVPEIFGLLIPCLI